MMSLPHPSPQRAVKPGRLGRVWVAAFAVALMMAGAVLAQGGMSKSTERLFDAVFKNDISAVKSSIPAGADLKAINSWGQTPADLAVDLGFFEIAHFLTSLRQFENREEENPPIPTARSFFDPEVTAPSALVPLSPTAPAVVLAPEMAPAPLPGGAFDPSIASRGSVLSVIGDIRGPEGTAVPDPLPPARLPAAEVAVRPAPLPAAEVAAGPAPKAVPTASGPPSPARPAAPASPGEPRVAAPAKKGSGFISNLWGQLADAFSEVPEEAADPVAAAPAEEESFSDMLGQLKNAFSTAPEDESAKEPVVAFGQAKPSAGESPGGGVSVDEDSGFISNMLGQLGVTSAAPEDESAKEPVVAYGEAKSPPAESPGTGAAKAAGPQVAAAEPAKKAPKSKPSFTERLSNFLSLDSKSSPRVKRRRRSRVSTDTAMIRFPMPARSSEFLKGVALNLSGNPNLGKTAPPTESCIAKNRGRVLFCVEPVAWPKNMRPHFKANTYMYGGAKSIVRYDDGKATFVHVLFPTASYQAVLAYFEGRFGPPTDQQELWLTSLSSPVRSNTIAAWWSIEGDGVTSLQIRTYDDTRGGFPDMEHGAISLHIQGAKPIFPLLSTANLMLLKFKRPPRKLP